MFRFLLIALALAGCNSIYVKPGTLDTTKTFYADRGGYTMRRSIKQQMEARGYNVVVGTAKSATHLDDGAEGIEIDSAGVPNDARYIVKVNERREMFNPFWCPLNGFWWWNFNVSIADQKTGQELMTWRGRGCSHSSLRKLNKILEQMEIK